VNDAKTALGYKIQTIKKRKKWTWPDIAAKLEHSPVWTCAACLGQMSMTEATAKKTGELFKLSDDEVELPREPPYRGSLSTAVPTDPLIYRFYELIQVYGTTWKELIQEEFGDGIMIFHTFWFFGTKRKEGPPLRAVFGLPFSLPVVASFEGIATA